MKVITLDKTNKISYFGEGQLQFVNCSFAKRLNLKLIDKDPEETIDSSFDRLYIRKSNLLCCLDQQSKDAFIVVFATKKICDKIFDAIVKVKSSLSQADLLIDETKVFQDEFFIPVMKAIQSGIRGHQELKKIVLEFVGSLDTDDKIVYLSFITDICLAPIFVSAESDEDMQDDSNANETNGNHISLPFNSSFNDSRASGAGFDESRNSQESRKRSFSNISSEETKTQNGVKSEFRCFDEPSPRNSSDDVAFDIVECLQNGRVQKKLLLFTSNDRRQCYEYFYRPVANDYRCIGCSVQRKYIVIKATVRNDGSKTFNFDDAQHVCQPINYLPENYHQSLILQPLKYRFVKRELKGVVRPLLRIFHPEDPSLCYNFLHDSVQNNYYCYGCRKERTKLTARFIHQNGRIAFELGRPEHRCQPNKYIPYGL